MQKVEGAQPDTDKSSNNNSNCDASSSRQKSQKMQNPLINLHLNPLTLKHPLRENLKFSLFLGLPQGKQLNSTSFYQKTA